MIDFSLASLAVLLVGLVVWKAGELRRLRSQLVTFQLTFPRALEAEGVTQFLSGLSGLLLPWWRRWLVTPFISAEIHASPGGIEHYLLVPGGWDQAIENLLQASAPAVRYQRVERPDVPVSFSAEYRLNTSQRPLRIDAPALSRKLLTNLQPLEPDEAVTVQWVISPAGPVAPARVATANERQRISTPEGVMTQAEAATALRAKQAHPLLLATGRLAVQAPTPARARRLLRHVEVAWHESRAPGVHLRRRLLPQRALAHRIAARVVPLAVWPGTYNAQELSGLIGWPIETTALPGVVLGGCRQLPASPLVPAAGTVLAEGTFPGAQRPLALDLQGRLRHVHVLGPTGTGKSTLLVNMAVQDLQAEHGVVLLDPKGDLVTDVLARVPAHRRQDVIVLDPADGQRIVGLNPLRAASGAAAEVVVENLVALFKSLYRSSWGPRTDDVLRAALLTLTARAGATLCEVPLLLTDPTFRRRIVGSLDDPVGLESFWGWYEGLSEAERLSVVGPVLNKVRAFTMRPRVRAIVGQSDPALELTDVLDSGKVLLVSLSSGLLGQEAAALLGAMVVAELWHATTARAGMEPAQRRPVMAYLDEWQYFLHLPTPMASVLAEARGLGLAMTLAHQHLGQLPEEAREAVLANARSRIVFQLAAGDARLVVRELGGVLSADDLQGLGPFEVVAQLFAGGTTQTPATGRTRALTVATSSGADLREASRSRYGIEREEVEAAIRARQQGGRAAGGVGRRSKPGHPESGR